MTSPAPDAALGSSSTGAMRWGRHRGLWADLFLLVFAGVGWSIPGIVMYQKFTSGLDLAIFDQGIRSLASFHPPIASLKSIGMNLWGDHFHPIIALAAPFYWIWPDPRILIILQAVCIGAGAVILRHVAADTLGYWFSLLIAVALLFSLGVQYALVFDFHEVSLGFPLLAGALALLLRDRPWWATGLLLGCLLIKEDMPVLVVGFGLVMLIRRHIKQGIVLLVVAPIWYVLTTKVIIPALAPNHEYQYAGAVSLRPSVIWSHLSQSVPGSSGLFVVLVVLILGAGGLAVRSPLMIPVLLNFLSRAVARNPHYWSFRYHYDLLPSLILAFATVDVLRRMGNPRPLIRRLVAACLGVMIVLNVIQGPLKTSLGWGSAQRARDAKLAVAAVPAGVPVAADVYLAGHLTPHHTDVAQLRAPDFLDDQGHPVIPSVDWIILDSKTISYPTDPHWVDKLSAKLLDEGWHRTATFGEWSVYHRGS